jgi:exopolysaccharide biosynthesis polyprenyl glycosylphosphotransferase
MTMVLESTSRLVSTLARRPSARLQAIAFALDLVLVAATIVASVVWREHITVFLEPAEISHSLSVAGPLIALVWLIAIAQRGGYDRDAFGAGTDEYKRVIVASLFTAGAVGVGCYLAKFPLSRGFFVIAFGLGIPLLVVGRFALRRAVHRARQRGALHERVLILGSPTHVDEIAGVFRRESWLGYRVAGAIVPSAHEIEETPSGIPVLGATDTIVETVERTGVDVLFVASGALTSSRQMRQIAWDLERHHVQLVVAPSVTDVSSERIRFRPVGGLPLVHLGQPRTLDASRWAKRAFDVLGALCLMVGFAPVLLFVALRIKLHDGGPVLFRHARIGRDGEEFSCLKFRTMVVDAEARLEALQREHGATALLFKLPEDPRVTAPGAWLRRYSLDELPQLFNVLKGDMSLVGPRPQVAREVECYSEPMTRRLLVRPGITGLWQVSGRNDLAVEDAERLDLYYVDNWSMVQDIVILLRTFGAVVRSRGAY